MSPIRALARPLLASVFVHGGIAMLREPEGRARAAGPVVDRIARAAEPVAEKVAEAAAPVVGDAVAKAPDPVAEKVRPVVERLGDPSTLLEDPVLMTQVNGAVMVGAGALLALGKVPRLASAALAAAIVPTTLASHRFWECDDPAERAAQQVHFMKDVGLLGGLALAAVDTGGRPGLAWRAGRARRDVGRRARSARRVARAEARLAAGKVAAAVPGG